MSAGRTTLKNMCIYDKRIKIASHELTYLESEIFSLKSMNGFLIFTVIHSFHFAIKYVVINFSFYICFLATTTS